MHLFPRARLVVLIALAAVFGSILSTAAQQQEINVNVIGCVDPDCVDTVNIFTMDGATVSSYDAAGALIDSCTVSSAPDGFDGCQLAATNDATFAITPSAEYAGYVLLSDAPAIFESPDRGVWVWYFAPEKDNALPPPTQAPAAPTVPAPVTGLPSTGVGAVASPHLAAVYAVIPFILAAAAVAANRIDRR